MIEPVIVCRDVWKIFGPDPARFLASHDGCPSVEEKNDALGVKRYHIVDSTQQLIRLAYKRNNGQPTYELPEYLENLSPKPNTKY